MNYSRLESTNQDPIRDQNDGLGIKVVEKRT